MDKDMAEIFLIHHQVKTGIRDGRHHCQCGWNEAPDVLETHLQHVAAFLSVMVADVISMAFARAVQDGDL